jgi:hypothetical protein
MTRNLQAALQRAEMTEQEIRSWHGVIKALVTGPHPATPRLRRTSRKGDKE